MLRQIDSDAPTDPVLDPARLAAVLRSALLDSPAEPAFDDLTRIAALVLDAPLAFATIVDETHSFWKSAYGVAAPQLRSTVEESFCQYVVRSERELVVSDAGVDERTCDNPAVVAMGVRAWLGFPLHAPGGEVLGSFCVVDVVPRQWSARDVEIVRTFASAASREVALRDAVRRERDARDRAEAIVRTLQVTLLPPVIPTMPGLDIAARFHSAGTGLDLVGDFYDVLTGRDGDASLVLGDVCGKGIEAAKLAAFARHAIGTIAMQPGGPAEILERLNATLLARSPAPDRFLTAVYASFRPTPEGCGVRLARAGHSPPILRRADGTLETIAPDGHLLGVLERVDVAEIELSLAPGDLIVVFTDGVDEARLGAGHPTFGIAALEAIVRAHDPASPVERLAERIEAATLDFSGGSASDDVAIVVVGLPLATTD